MSNEARTLETEVRFKLERKDNTLRTIQDMLDTNLEYGFDETIIINFLKRNFFIVDYVESDTVIPTYHYAKYSDGSSEFKKLK